MSQQGMTPKEVTLDVEARLSPAATWTHRLLVWLALFAIVTGSGLFLHPTTAFGSGPEPASVFSAAKGPIEPWLRDDVQLVDARDRDRWLRARLPNSIYIYWEQLSGVGLGSRGSLPARPEQLREALGFAGLSPERPTLVLGHGLKGFGDEWRVAWMLRWLGFKKVSAMPYDAYIDKARGQKSLVEQAGPHRPQPLSRAQARRAASARLWTSELITAQQLDRLVAKKTAPILLDVREEKWSGPLPRPLSELKSYRLHWKEAIEPDGRLSQSLVKKQVVQDLKAELALRKGPAAQVVVVSFAGLSSALVTMALREVSIDAVNLSEGLSWYL